MDMKTTDGGERGDVLEREATVARLMSAAFHIGREPRSEPYKSGCRQQIAYRLGGKKPACPWPHGSPQCDAFYAGVDEGWAIAREELERRKTPEQRLEETKARTDYQSTKERRAGNS